MNSIRRLFSLTICFFVLMSVCPLYSATSTSTSLWGQKLHFKGIPCLWQLQPDVVVPALKELSVCILLRRTIGTKWTGFVYKGPGDRQVVLGLEGTDTQLTVWLFGKEWPVQKEMILNEWYSVCIAWSGKDQHLKIYINGTTVKEEHLNSILPQQLAQNGTLTLGVSHFTVNGEVQQESGTDLIGEIGLFRIWAREWSSEELGRLSCVDGDVINWDLRQWKYSCPPEPDSSLHCAWSLYKINMWTFIVPYTNPANCSMSPEEITRSWLESIFPTNISVQEIFISSPSCTCHMVNTPAPVHAQQPQGLEAQSNVTCSKGFSSEVYINVNPAAKVEVVQADVAELLTLTFSFNFLNLTTDPNTISILPVELLSTEHPPTVSTTATTSETHPTQSMPAQPTNMSTTGEPLDLNETVVGPDTFFRVNLNLRMTGSPTKPIDIIEKWLKDQLERNDTMIVLNLVIKDNIGRNVETQYTGLMTSYGQQKQYYCTFHVQEYNVNSIEEILAIINASLTLKYENGTLMIETMGVEIKHIVPENCLEETLTTIYGPYIWPEAFPQVNQEMECEEPKSERAYRLCKLDINTDMTNWADPDMTRCKQLTISDLDNVTVTTGNAAEVVGLIEDLVNVQLGNSEELSSSELDLVVEKLSEVVDKSIIEPVVGADIAHIIADILLSKTDVSPVSSSVLNLTDRMGDIMDFQGESVGVTAPSLAFSMNNVDRVEFSGLTFGVSSFSSTMNPEIFVNQSFVSEPLSETVATISLPSALHNFFRPGVKNTTRIQFQFYGTHKLFQDPTTTTQNSWRLNSYVISASINNSHVINLSSKDRVVVTFSHQPPKKPEDIVQCMFWDFQKNDGRGGWNGSGCETRNISSSQTRCLCNHLTHFALLLDVSRGQTSETDSQILTVISYLGCGISSIFLGITLLTYLSFEKLRRDYPSKILINLSTALLGLSMLFLLDSWLSSFSNYGLCITTAATLHYFLLASFAWMGLEALHMYLALVKVFNTYIPSYILKCCIVGWGIPMLIVSLVLAIDKDAYGSIVPEEAAVVLQSSDPFCWLQSDIFFYLTVVAFVFLILLCNISVFIVVLIQIRQTRTHNPAVNTRSTLHDLRAVASLTVLLGLTWSLGLFSFGPGRVVLMYLFVIFSTFQGFFVFLFHCLMKENVRKQWRIHLCCGRFRLSDYSDWSRSVIGGGQSKKNNLINCDSEPSDNTSTMGSSTRSAPNHHQGA